MPTDRSLLLKLYAISTVLAVVILGPMLRSLGGGRYLLYRDAVSTPRSYVTDTALGVGGVPARSVPQDWLLAVLTPVVDGGIVVVTLLAVGLVLAGVGFGRLAARVVPGSGHAGACVAAVVAVWNPFVAERLLQGHWSLLVSYAALGWLIVTVLDRPNGWRGWVVLATLFAWAGFTPSGSVLGAVVAVVAVVASGVSGHRGLAIASAWVVGALPWLVASLVGGATTTSSGAGVEAFGMRAEPGLGGLGTAAGLGGIWNADAVPGSRGVWWAGVATAAFVVVAIVGVVELWRHHRDSPVWAVFAGCAVVALVAVAAAATGPGESVLSRLVESVPGAGLVRDTQKYVALAVPFYAIAACAAVGALRRWVPAGFAVAAGLLLVVAPLPDLAWGVGGSLRTVALPDSFRQAAQVITADHGMVAISPPGQIRRFSFTGTPSLDPLPRMVRASVVDAGALTVDDVAVDPPSGRGADIDAALRAGGDPRRLAELGVGWVIVEGHDIPALLRTITPVMTHSDMTVVRIPGEIRDTGAGSGIRAAAWAAHLLWLATIVTGAIVAAGRSRATRSGRRFGELNPPVTAE
ncbi:hypothetical protein GII30_02845 [Gordonia amarae]|uniref:Glycosyltransferase RgtA/B/C/D-like domain-containing protein n=2 Tax=Gordonia amarae TaxID=36821 RepID=G7GWJ9_9ACTN|nr:hypothetical protein [Gordonia amarae]MCS3877296.1 hypothetical protein [Gordonia amarae]QHN16065.1 hypothetical protein GII35_02850 [Gordonia amarae]QHN20633.1 hypothetical protein GII34_02850 [Gordonia amarae]QHN38261.1 hypothetical protein GII30_02845 [Gordonia amarae]GAB07974.1 hypothetical protein GOAMR_76_00440 [Gordonia amarae NBRC 15530]